QSTAFKDDKRNLKTQQASHTSYRFNRMQELLSENEVLNPERAAEILRNRDGLKAENLGMGNEKAINQLLAHHGIIFKPQERKVWVSANPYQLGAFVAYDLDEAFSRFISGENKNIALTEETI